MKSLKKPQKSLLINIKIRQHGRIRADESSRLTARSTLWNHDRTSQSGRLDGGLNVRLCVFDVAYFCKFLFGVGRGRIFGLGRPGFVCSVGGGATEVLVVFLFIVIRDPVGTSCFEFSCVILCSDLFWSDIIS